MSEDYKRFLLKTNITGTTINDIIIRFNYNLGSPNYGKAMLKFKDKLYELIAIINIEEKAFTIDIKIPGMDDMSLSGQFGSTTFKTLYSLKQGRIKREISLLEQLNSRFTAIELNESSH